MAPRRDIPKHIPTIKPRDGVGTSSTVMRYTREKSPLVTILPTNNRTKSEYLLEAIRPKEQAAAARVVMKREWRRGRHRARRVLRRKPVRLLPAERRMREETGTPNSFGLCLKNAS